MFDFKALGRWRPDTLTAAADYLEAGRPLPHFGHLYNVSAVVEALRHCAARLRLVRIHAYEAAGVIFEQGWEFREEGDSIMVRGIGATNMACDSDLDHVDDLMTDYAANLADALTDAHTIAHDLRAVVRASTRDPNERLRVRAHRPLRPDSGGRVHRHRHRHN